MTQPQTDTLTPYAPLPVRARGTLEIFDTAFKLFRRYAGVLMAWSALSSMVNLVPFLGQLLYIFTMPFMFGAVSCVVAGAVRGQNVGFRQIWGFTKPRYGALLGVLILALILMGMVAIGLLIVTSIGVAIIGSAVSSFGWFATGVAWIVGILAGLVGSSFLLALMMGWFNLAPVIACLEDNNRGSNAVSRAWALLKGNWRKACGVATILSLAGTAVSLILSGFAFLFFGGGWDKFVGLDMSSVSMLAVWGFFTLFFLAWTPLQAVVGAVFYLDLRTRKEALDLEWTNYAAKPETLPGQEARASQPASSPAPPSPAGVPPYAPASSLPPTPSFPDGAVPPPSPSSPADLPAQTASPIFVAQSPTPEIGAEVAPLNAPTPVAPQSESFATREEATPQNSEPLSPLTTPVETVSTPAIMAPTPVASVPLVSAEPEAVFQPSSVPTEPAPITPLVDLGVVEPSVVEPSVAIPPAEPMLTPVAPTPEPTVAPPAPPIPVPAPEPEATSSFAPRRFRRAASEDDDYPSSFGGAR